jgi:hypothetical protein
MEATDSRGRLLISTGSALRREKAEEKKEENVV